MPARYLARPTAAPQRPTDPAPLRHLLSALASETADLAARADQLQGLVGQLMADPPVRSPDAVERAQTLDSLVQRLQGLNAFLAELGSRPLHDLPAEAAKAASTLRLTSQASRFSAIGASAAPGDDTGECQLF